MKESRLSKSSENHCYKANLYQYTQQHILPITTTSSFLSTRMAGSTSEPFDDLLFSVFQKISVNYPECSYQQLQQKIERRQLTPIEHQHLENGLYSLNQKLVTDNQRLSQDKENWYKSDRNHFIKHPFSSKRPDKSRYQSLSFSLSDSPYTLDHAVKILALTFQALAEEQARLDFKFTQKLEADQERDRQDQVINQKTSQLAQAHHETNDKTYDLLAKEEQLKRELERLKHLTSIAKGYAITEDHGNLTSPAEQIEALEKLLEQKRRG